MQGFFVLLGLLFLIAPILGIVSFVRVSRINKDVEAMRRELKALRQAQGGTTPDPVSEPAETKSTPPPAQAPTPTEPSEAVSSGTGTAPSLVRAPHTAAPKTAKAKAPNWRVAETLRGANWLIIAGGVALSFALVFLVKYSIDEGWLGPKVRIALGMLFGFLLLGAGEVARRKPLGRMIAIASNDAFPATLTAAGIIALYASIYGAYILYDLLPPLATFVGLAIVSAIAVLLSFFHGPLIAVLGIVGAYGIPLLVTTRNPQSETLFGYLFLVTLGAAAMARLRYWWWLAGGGLLASLAWTGVWAEKASVLHDRNIPLIYWTLIGLLYAGLFLTMERKPVPEGKQKRTPAEWNGRVGVGLSAMFVFMLFSASDPEFLSVALLFVWVLGHITIAWINTRANTSLYGAVAVGLGGLASWDIVRTVKLQENIDQDWAYPAPLIPEGALEWELVALVLSLIFVGVGIARTLLRKPAAGLWSSLGVGFALAALTIVYLRVNGFENSMSWAMVGVTGAIFFLASARVVYARVGADVDHPALAAYAIGVLASLGLGMAMALERAWLTVGLALLLPAMGWVYSKLPVPKLRLVALATAALVIVRLVLNNHVLEYDIVRPLILNWTLYGYGLPAVAFFLASRFFLKGERDLTVNVLETGALAFGALCLSLQVRIFVHDGVLNDWTYDLAEAAINTILWIAIAYGLFRRTQPGGSPVAAIGARVFAAMALANILLGHLLIQNPYWTGEEVGKLPLLNSLALAYLVPAALLSLFYLPWHRERLSGIFGLKKPGQGEAILSFFAYALGFAWATLEVTRGFHGGDLTAGETTDAELYTYSLVWLLYAAALMGVGIWRHIPALRLAGLVTIGLAAIKIFYFDMSNLQGLYRVFSFLGLALSLFAIAYLYQRFVIPSRSDPSTEEEPAKKAEPDE